MKNNQKKIKALKNEARALYLQGIKKNKKEEKRRNKSKNDKK